MAKPKLALYWAASCGGCEIAVLDLHQRILQVAEAFDIVFWPVALDFKYDAVRAMDDLSIDLCLFNGSIRNSENGRSRGCCGPNPGFWWPSGRARSRVGSPDSRT